MDRERRINGTWEQPGCDEEDVVIWPLLPPWGALEESLVGRDDELNLRQVESSGPVGHLGGCSRRAIGHMAKVQDSALKLG